MVEDTKTEQPSEGAGKTPAETKVPEGEARDNTAEEIPRPDVEKPAIAAPFWPKWRCLQHYHVPLAEAVLLSCDMDPESYYNWNEIATDPTDWFGFDRLDMRMEISTRVSKVAGETFDVVRVPERDGGEKIMVRLNKFALWAKDMEKQLEKDWGKLPDDFRSLAVEQAPTWPWGPSYTNSKLNALADTVEIFWRNYDKDAPRPPRHSKEDVIEYLTKTRRENVVPTVAEAIDYVTRPDNWRPGPAKGAGFPKGSKGEQ